VSNRAREREGKSEGPDGEGSGVWGARETERERGQRKGRERKEEIGRGWEC